MITRRSLLQVTFISPLAAAVLPGLMPRPDMERFRIERAVLACMLVHYDWRTRCSVQRAGIAALRVSDFADLRHRIVFLGMRKGSPIDPSVDIITLVHRLSVWKLLPAYITADYVCSLIDEIPDLHAFPAYVTWLRAHPRTAACPPV